MSPFKNLSYDLRPKKIYLENLYFCLIKAMIKNPNKKIKRDKAQILKYKILKLNCYSVKISDYYK